YDAPIARTAEIIEICRSVWRRERLVHSGARYQIPLPEGQGTGLGKPLKLITNPVRDQIPVYVASLGPKNVELTAAIADGWLPLQDRKSTRLNSSHTVISYAVFCLQKK